MIRKNVSQTNARSLEVYISYNTVITSRNEHRSRHMYIFQSRDTYVIFFSTELLQFATTNTVVKQ